MARRLRTKNGTYFYLLIKTAFFYPSDLVNAKTNIPLRVGEERWIYIPRRFASRNISTTIHLPFGE